MIEATIDSLPIYVAVGVNVLRLVPAALITLKMPAGGVAPLSFQVNVKGSASASVALAVKLKVDGIATTPLVAPGV